MLLQLTEYFIFMPTAFIIQGILTLLPTVNFLQSGASPIAGAFEWFFGIMARLDPIFPYSTQLNILSIIVGYYGTLFTFKLVSWILRKIPFTSLS